MADVRINGRRFPILQAVDVLGTVVEKLEAFAAKEHQALTSMSLNGSVIDIDNPEYGKLKLDPHDTLEALLETPEQLALQSLQVAQEMAELLVFDLKVATLCLWDNTRNQNKSLENLINDCNLFLTLGARPLDLLNQDLGKLEKPIEDCLKQLDRVANNLEDAILLAAHDKLRESAHILVARVMPAIEVWIDLSAAFAEHLSLTSSDFEFETTSREAPPMRMPAFPMRNLYNRQ